MKRWLVSQEDHGAGRWIVHAAGGNRPDKIAWSSTREEAEDIAARVNVAVADGILTEREACATIAHDVLEAVGDDGGIAAALVIENRIRRRGDK